MQPSNTLLALLCAFTLISCNQNTPDDTKKGGDTPTSQHQPSDPATWSPEGKMYVCDVSKDNSFGETYFMDVIAFYTKDSAAEYCTTNRDLTPTDVYPYNVARYSISYPNVRFDYGGVIGDYEFIDTLTLGAMFQRFTLNP